MKKNKRTLLWKMEREDLPGKSYLFGTMHVSDERAFAFEELVQEKILKCDAFATEFNLEEAHENLTAEAMSLSDGQTLESLIPPKKIKKVNRIFKKMTGLDLRFFNNSLPMLVTNLMTESILSKDRLKSLDESLWQFARENEKITLGIETLEEQMEIMKKIPLESQIKGMLDMAKNFKQFRKQVLRLTEVYMSADVQKIFKTTKKSSGGLRKLLLYDRNQIMADRIAEMIKEKTIVCAIGAGHLGGKKGVIRLLKKEGFKVKPVN